MATNLTVTASSTVAADRFFGFTAPTGLGLGGTDGVDAYGGNADPQSIDGSGAGVVGLGSISLSTIPLWKSRGFVCWGGPDAVPKLRHQHAGRDSLSVSFGFRASREKKTPMPPSFRKSVTGVSRTLSRPYLITVKVCGTELFEELGSLSDVTVVTELNFVFTGAVDNTGMLTTTASPFPVDALTNCPTLQVMVATVVLPPVTVLTEQLDPEPGTALHPVFRLQLSRL